MRSIVFELHQYQHCTSICHALQLKCALNLTEELQATFVQGTRSRELEQHFLFLLLDSWCKWGFADMALSSTLHLVPPIKNPYLGQQRKQLAPRSSFSQLRINQLPFPKFQRSDIRCRSAVSPDNNGAEEPSDGSIAAAISPSVTKLTPSPPAEDNGTAQGPALFVGAAAVGVEGETALPSPPSKQPWIFQAESLIERAIFDFRFLTLMAVVGSLAGSLLCFLKGCGFVFDSFVAYFRMCMYGHHTGKVILRLVEAVDVYLVGTVMLIFGMGLYGLFISSGSCDVDSDRALENTTLFGMFALKERPPWMRISSLDALKTKLGHVIVMILLVKMFEKSKTVVITTTVDLFYYSVSIFLSSASLYVLTQLQH